MFVDLGETFMILQGFIGNVKMSGRFNPTELPSTISPHLKSVKVRCATVDRRVLKVLEFLSKLNISMFFFCATLSRSIYLCCLAEHVVKIEVAGNERTPY